MATGLSCHLLQCRVLLPSAGPCPVPSRAAGSGSASRGCFKALNFETGINSGLGARGSSTCPDLIPLLPIQFQELLMVAALSERD